jgi:hypothetical protein
MGALKIFFGRVFGIIVLALWFFGGIIGAFIAVAKDEALMAVASLLVPCFGAIYTIVSFFGAVF